MHLTGQFGANIPAGFAAADWAVLAAYVGLMGLAGWLATRRDLGTSGDYFLDSRRAPAWLIAVSLLSTVQSAATFLGVPDYAYRGDFTYLGGAGSALIAAVVVARVLIPRFHALKVATVYELLELRFDARARRAAAAMFLIGRIFASGARLYLAAIAIAMMLFLDITPAHIVIAAALLLVLGLAFTLWGGLHSVLWSDLLQVMLDVGAAAIAALVLWARLPLSAAEAWAALTHGGAHGASKLALIDWHPALSASFSLPALLTGLVLLNIASSGLDQDCTQRLIAAGDPRRAARSLYASVLISAPVVLLFLGIGALLWLTYHHSSGGAGSAASGSFHGEKVTVFMYYILTALPPGLRGLACVGVLAAAAMNSELIAMAAVAVNDLYRPWREARRPAPPSHYLNAARAASVLLGLALFGMAIASYYWQHYADAGLLDFVLGVMSFAYSGLLGVFGVALFTRRGSAASVIAAFAAGFVCILLFQPFVVDALALPLWLKGIAFPWQLCLGTALAAAICATAPAERAR